eukprot:476902-Rhodomonas_salina.7
MQLPYVIAKWCLALRSALLLRVGCSGRREATSGTLGTRPASATTLRARYAMSSTMTAMTSQFEMMMGNIPVMSAISIRGRCAMSGTNKPYAHAVSLRVRYAMPGTNIACAGTRKISTTMTCHFHRAYAESGTETEHSTSLAKSGMDIANRIILNITRRLRFSNADSEPGAETGSAGADECHAVLPPPQLPPRHRGRRLHEGESQQQHIESPSELCHQPEGSEATRALLSKIQNEQLSGSISCHKLLCKVQHNNAGIRNHDTQMRNQMQETHSYLTSGCSALF